MSKSVLLAFSGGLDTCCILAWLVEQGYEVMAYMANVGQQEDFDLASDKARSIGAKRVFVEDLRREFLDQTIFPAIKGNCVYENDYLMGTALARPVIAQRQIEIAMREGCEYVAHGCTGKGNDQVRFELAYLALCPQIKILAPWRMSEFYNRFQGRMDLIDYAEKKGLPVVQTKAKPWSTDENMFHISYEAGILEDPLTQPPEHMWKLTKSLQEASPDGPCKVTLCFLKGIPSSIKVQTTAEGTLEYSDKLQIFECLNQLGRLHGIGRIDIVENRYIGIKSRGCYETPAGTILMKAHRDLEGLTMDREVRRLRDECSEKLSRLIYNGLWFSPERQLLTSLVDQSQEFVSGQVLMELYKGNVVIVGRSSEYALYDQHISSMDVAGGFEPSDSTGFINIQSIRLKANSKRENKKYF